MSEISRNEPSNNLSWSVVVRVGTVLAGCVLLSLGVGHSLTTDAAQQCYQLGLFGMAIYFCLELLADRRESWQIESARRTHAEKLSRRVQSEQKIIECHQNVSHPDQQVGTIESAIDSRTDLAVYVGPLSQPTLSV